MKNFRRNPMRLQLRDRMYYHCLELARRTSPRIAKVYLVALAPQSITFQFDKAIQLFNCWALFTIWTRVYDLCTTHLLETLKI